MHFIQSSVREPTSASTRARSWSLEENTFIEMVLAGSILRRLGEAEKNAYGRPYLEPGEARRPMPSSPREFPINGEPKDILQIAHASH